MLTPGQQLFEYHILAGLGRGGFGAVYLAEDTLLKRPVAIKELDEATQKDQLHSSVSCTKHVWRAICIIPMWLPFMP